MAGDVADSLAVVADVLGLLRERFAQVFFVPGDKELWVQGEARGSLEKFEAVLDTCRAAGVHTAPARAGGAWVVPLFSWVETPASTCGARPTPRRWRRGPTATSAGGRRGWSGWTGASWPSTSRTCGRYDAPVVSFSHFVPRTELLPAVSWLRFKGLPLVAGSVEIDAQVRRLGAAVHVYGHTHIPDDRMLDGVRYVQNHLRAEGSGEGGLLKRVWDDGVNEPPPGPLFC